MVLQSSLIENARHDPLPPVICNGNEVPNILEKTSALSTNCATEEETSAILSNSATPPSQAPNIPEKTSAILTQQNCSQQSAIPASASNALFEESAVNADANEQTPKRSTLRRSARNNNKVMRRIGNQTPLDYDADVNDDEESNTGSSDNDDAPSDVDETPKKERKPKATLHVRKMPELNKDHAASVQQHCKAAKEGAVKKKKLNNKKASTSEDWSLLESNVPVAMFEKTLRETDYTCCSFLFNKVLWRNVIIRANEENPDVYLGKLRARKSDKVKQRATQQKLNPLTHPQLLSKLWVPEHLKDSFLYTLLYKRCNSVICSTKKMLAKSGKKPVTPDEEKMLETIDDQCCFNIKAEGKLSGLSIYYTGNHCGEFYNDKKTLRKDKVIKAAIIENLDNFGSDDVKKLVKFVHKKFDIDPNNSAEHWDTKEMSMLKYNQTVQKFGHPSTQWSNLASMLQTLKSSSKLSIRQKINGNNFDEQSPTHFMYQFYCDDNIDACKDYGLEEVFNFDCVWSLAKISKSVIEANIASQASRKAQEQQQDQQQQHNSNNNSNNNNANIDDDDDNDDHDDDNDDNNEPMPKLVLKELEGPSMTFPVYCLTTVNKFYKAKIISIAICSHENAHFIYTFIKGIKKYIESKLKRTWSAHGVIDDGAANICAFNMLKNNNILPSFSLCKFHVVRSWWKRLAISSYDKDTQKDIMAQLYLLAVQKEEDSYNKLYTGLVADYPDFFNGYFEDNYNNKKELWTNFNKKNCYSAYNTNNLIERKFRELRDFIKKRNGCRIDVLMIKIIQ